MNTVLYLYYYHPLLLTTMLELQYIHKSMTILLEFRYGMLALNSNCGDCQCN